MTWSIAKKEILENLTTYRFYILTGLLCILVIVSIIVLYGDYRLRVENYDILLPKPNSADVIIPPNPLSIFVKGLDENLGRLYEISILGVQAQASQQSINRLFSPFTVPDMLFIIKVMLALIAVLFSFDAICGEKESGTLRLLLAGGSQRASVLLGKLVGRFVLVYVPFFVIFLAATIVVSILPLVKADGYYWQRIAIVVIISGVYALVYASLGLFISSLVPRSSTSMMLCLGLWVFFVFVVPNMGVTAAKSLSDIPPSDRIEMESRLAAIHAIYEKTQKERSDTEGDRGFGTMVRQIREANSQLFESYRPKLNRLIQTTKSIVRISPSGAVTFLLADVADTGLSEELRLKDAITLHVNRNLNKVVGLERGAIENFQYQRASLAGLFTESAFVDALVLVLFNFVFIGLATVSFLRYDPR